MKKIFLPFIAIAIMTFFVACSNEDLITEENTTAEVETEEGYTLSLTASMPEDEPTTRVALTEEGKNINLTWQSDDRLQLIVVQDNKIKGEYAITINSGNIADNGKKVNFTLTLPEESTGFERNSLFDIYGLYGYYNKTSNVGSFSGTNVILTRDPGSISNLLTAVQNRGDVMIYFESKDIDINNPPTKMTFNHLGSLFSIQLKNTSTTELTKNFNEFRLVGVNNPDNEKWAYNSGAGGQHFDLTDGTFQDPESAGNYISFSTTGQPNSLASEGIMTVWAWYPPLPNKTWPELKLELRDAASALWTSVNSKPARTEPTPAGRAFHFYAVWDGTNLNFTNDQFEVPTP